MFTVTTQKPQSCPVSGKARSFHVRRKRGKSDPQNQECVGNLFGCGTLFYHEFVIQSKSLTRITIGSFRNT